MDAATSAVILLVEDEEPIRELINMALSTRYKVHICAQSNRAVDLAKSLPAPPDLLITDIHMTGLAGPDLAAELLRDFSGLRILFISGYASNNPAVHDALAIRNAAYLRKPFALQELRAEIEKVLAGPPAELP